MNDSDLHSSIYNNILRETNEICDIVKFKLTFDKSKI